MKDFLKLLFSGIQIIFISIISTICFVSEVILYRDFVQASGFSAIISFLAMIIVFVIGFMLLIFLGDVGRRYKNIINKK